MNVSQQGADALTAVATDALGNSATSARIVNITVGPQVSITAPANNTNFHPGSSIGLAATATETGVAITNVAFYANATKIGSSTSAPYSFDWINVPGGLYALTAVADALGNSATSAVVNITVGPSVRVTAPANNATFNPASSVVLAATASETGVSITNVAFYANGTLLANAAGVPYSFSWMNVPGGSYALTAVAGDALGYSSTSAAVNVTVTPSVAFDLESNYSTWASGQNEGYGFKPWVLVGGGQYYGFILNPSGTIDTSGDSWALYANGTGAPYAYAYRGFSNALTGR